MHVVGVFAMQVVPGVSSAQVGVPSTQTLVVAVFVTQRASCGLKWFHSGVQSGGVPSQSMSVSGTK